MADKRIPNTTLPPNYSDGQVLYGSDVNQIIAILKAGINANKDDIDQILAGSKNVISATTLEGLNEYSTENLVAENSYGYVFGSAGLKVYIYDGGTWVFEKDLSLIQIFEEGFGSTHKISYTQPEEQRVDDLWYHLEGEV